MSDQSKPDGTEWEPNEKEPTFHRRAFLGIGALGVLGLSGVTGLVFAQRDSTNSTGWVDKTDDTGNDGQGRQNGSQSSTDKESGSESENDGESDTGEGLQDEQGESDRKNDKPEVKPSQVALSAQQARTAATKRVNGTVQTIDLGNQNGTPAYEVLVKTTEGSTKEVAIDANSGTVLNVEAQD